MLYSLDEAVRRSKLPVSVAYDLDAIPTRADAVSGWIIFYGSHGTVQFYSNLAAKAYRQFIDEATEDYREALSAL